VGRGEGDSFSPSRVCMHLSHLADMLSVSLGMVFPSSTAASTPSAHCQQSQPFC
jgi:hypothetical protein